MHRTGVATLGVALVLGLVGCGGSGALSKADFAKQGNAACTSARVKVQKMRGRGIEGFVAKVIAYEDAKLQGVAALKPPGELQTDYARYKTVLTQRRDLIARLGKVLQAKHRISTQDEHTVAGLQAQEEKLAIALGLRSCAERSAPSRH
jgi:hypothetical protein